MRRWASYVKKYGPNVGLKLYTALQKEAAHARWKAFYQAKSKVAGV